MSLKTLYAAPLTLSLHLRLLHMHFLDFRLSNMRCWREAGLGLFQICQQGNICDIKCWMAKRPLSCWFILERKEACLEMMLCPGHLVIVPSFSQTIQIVTSAGNISRWTKWLLFWFHMVLLEICFTLLNCFGFFLHLDSCWFHSWLKAHWSFAPQIHKPFILVS